MLVGTLPEREQQRTDTLPFLYIEEVIIRVERVEGNRTFIGIGEIHAVLALGLAVDKLAQALIAVTRIDQEHVCPLLVILAYHVVGEKRLTTARRP